MPPRLQRERDPRVTRITRADARANPAVNANVLASRGLAELPTAAETAAIEQSVVDDRNNRPPPSPKKKRNAGAKPTGIKPKKKETKEERRLRRKKEKAEAAKKAAGKAAKKAAKEAAEAAKALDAVEAAKALEAIKAAEAEAAKNEDGKGGKGKDGKGKDGKGKDRKKTKGKTGGPPVSSTSYDTGGSGSTRERDRIAGAEFLKRPEGIDWKKLGEKLGSELYTFIQYGGTREEWEKKRSEEEILEKLTEEIGVGPSDEEGGEEEGGEEEGGEEEGGEEEGGKEEGGEEEGGEEGGEDTDEEYEDAEGGTEPETDGGDDDIPEGVIYHGSRSELENGDEPEIESDPEVDDEEEYGSDDISCPGGTDIESGSESDNREDGINWHYVSPISSPTSGNQTAHVNGGGPNSKSTGSDPNKSFGKNVAGKKRKPEDSPELKPTEKTKLDDYSSGKMDICFGPRDHTPRRWDIGAKTAVPQDPSKPKKPSGTKRKGDKLPEPNPSGKKRKGDELPRANPWKRGKREETIICRLPECPPKKSHRDEGIICAIPTSWATDRWERRAKEAASANAAAKKSSGTKRKSAESTEKKSSMKRVREEEPKGSNKSAGKKVGWLW